MWELMFPEGVGLLLKRAKRLLLGIDFARDSPRATQGRTPPSPVCGLGKTREANQPGEE